MPTITGSAPTARTIYRFRALQDFNSFENGSSYVTDQLYNVRAGNEQLHELVQIWVTQNKVEVI